ncbi:MAG: hypothetical protein QM765_20250 [Myxococcales bacterium]
MRELPLNDENLRSVLPAPRKPMSECANCRAIGGPVSRLDKGDEEGRPLPAAVGKLVYFMGLGEHVNTNWLERCPECDALYYAERSYEFLMNGSETYESHEPISADGVLELPGGQLGAQASSRAARLRRRPLGDRRGARQESAAAPSLRRPELVEGPELILYVRPSATLPRLPARTPEVLLP